MSGATRLPLDLRPLRVDDLPALTALEQRSQPLPWSEDQLLLELVHDAALVLGAVGPSGAPMGYVALRRILEELWVLNIAVAPEHRRAGVAQALLQHGVEHGRQHACTSMWLEVRASNTPARALYERLGFTARGMRPLYYPPLPPAQQRETAVLMARPI